MKDLHSKISVVAAIPAAVYTADNVPAALDLAGYQSAEIILNVGAGGIAFDATNKIEFKVTHSDDNVTYTNVADADLLGVAGTANGIVKALTSAQAAGAAYRFGYKGAKRYLKILADFSGAHGTGTPIAATLIKGDGVSNPQANQN